MSGRVRQGELRGEMGLRWPEIGSARVRRVKTRKRVRWSETGECLVAPLSAACW